MKAIILMFDSLNRLMLEPYGCEWTQTPNFQRLAQKTTQFNNCYSGSLPCIPARRELHTGRYNFLHRSWGPLEPWDDSMPELLKNSGVHTHLVSDHTHYWEDGGATYHTRYSTWEFMRGQEGDPWKVLPELLQKSKTPQNKDGQYFEMTGKLHRQDAVNRKFCATEPETPLARTFTAGLGFLEQNHQQDNWMLQIECFDPHEPFTSPNSYQQLYPDAYDGAVYDWPPYHHVTEDAKTANHLKLQYAALLSMCDAYLGKLLQAMDDYQLWDDTMLIVNTDHGYLLGEHGWWSKGCMPWYDELVHLPLFIHDPRFPCAGQQRQQIVQTIDVPATVLEFFGQPLPPDMQGRPLRTVIQENQPVRDYALFGVHGGHINLFDGRYVYMKAPQSPENKPLYEYTLMPTHMRDRFSVPELQQAQLAAPFGFTKGCPVLRVPKIGGFGQDGFRDLLWNRESQAARHMDNNSLTNAANFGDKLFDLHTDPRQETELDDIEAETMMANKMVNAMLENEAPAEQFDRVGLPMDRRVTPQDIQRAHNVAAAGNAPQILPDRQWSKAAVHMYRALLKFIQPAQQAAAAQAIENSLRQQAAEQAIDAQQLFDVVPAVIPPEHCEMIRYFLGLAGRIS